jgi:uncharacterized protein (TIGR03437 family)
VLKGTGEYDSYKIFRYSGGQFTLVAQVPATASTPGGTDTFFFALRTPQVSGDGRVFTYDGTATCTGRLFCQGSFTARGTIVGATLPPVGNIAFYGSLRVSRDGRYVLWFGGTWYGGDTPMLVDLAARTATQLSIGGVISDGVQAIAQDGTVVLNGMSPVLWRNGQVQPLQFSQTPSFVRLSEHATQIVYESALPGDHYCLRTYSVASGRETLLAEGPYIMLQFPCTWCPRPLVSSYEPSYFRPSLSNDGRVVLFRAPDAAGVPQAFVENTDGSGQRALTSVQDGVAEAVLSGFGNRAYAVTNDGALLEIDVASGKIDTLSPDAAQVTGVTGAFVPGAIVQLQGKHMVDSGGHVQVQADGVHLFSLGGDASSLFFQVPWELPLSHPVVLHAGATGSAFEQVQTFPALMAAPLFFSALDPKQNTQTLAALHQDFRSMVTGEDPARPGEIVHLYLTGLGPVDHPIAAGAVSPGITRATTPLACQFTPYGPQGTSHVSAEILFAGLAPGFIGLNQLDLVVPPALASNAGQTSADELTCIAGRPPNTQKSGTAVLMVASQPF